MAQSALVRLPLSTLILCLPVLFTTFGVAQTDAPVPPYDELVHLFDYDQDAPLDIQEATRFGRLFIHDADVNIGRIGDNTSFHDGRADSGYYFKGLIDEVELYNRALSDGEIKAIYDAGNAGAPKPALEPPPVGPMNRWPGDGNAEDAAGFIHGDLRNGTTFAQGKVGQAFSFDGVDDYVAIPNSAGINAGGPYTHRTIALWFKARDDVTARQVLWEEGGGSKGLSIYLDQGFVYTNGWNLWSDDGGLTTPWGPLFVKTAIRPDVFYHVVLVFNHSTGMLSGFLNGVRFSEVVVGAREPEGARAYDISYASPKGGRVSAYLVVPKGQGPFAGVIFQHDFPGGRDQDLYEMMDMAERGAVVLVIDTPYARRQKGTAGAAIVTFTEQDADEQIQLVVDLRRGIDLLAARADVEPNRIACVGAYYGSTIGGILAGVDQRIKTYVLRMGHASLSQLLIGKNPEGFESLSQTRREQWLSWMAALHPVHYIGHAAPATLFFQAFTGEETVPEDEGHQLQGAAGEPKRVTWYNPDADSNDKAREDQFAWLQEQIGIYERWFETHPASPPPPRPLTHFSPPGPPMESRSPFSRTETEMTRFMS